MGKTALATNIAYNAAQNILKATRKILGSIFSLEMSSEQLSTRILSEQARIKLMTLEEAKLLKKKLIDILKHQEIFTIYHYILMKHLQLQLQL